MKNIVSIISVVVIALTLIMVVLIPFTNIKSDNSTLDVIIIDGQSNGAYSRYCLPEVVQEDYLEIPTHNLYYYGTEQYPIGYYAGDYDKTFSSYSIYPIWDGSWHIGGYEPILANELSKRSNHDVLVINISIGGASISELEPNTYGGTYGFNAISDALTKVNGYNTINMVGWIWIQGESNKNTPIDLYEIGFKNIQNKFYSIGAKNCYIVEVPDRYGGNSNIALQNIANNDPNVKMFSDITNAFTVNNGCLVDGDEIHWTQKGRNEISTILGDDIQVTSYGNYPTALINFVAIIPIFVIIGLIVGIFGYFLINRRM